MFYRLIAVICMLLGLPLQAWGLQEHSRVNDWHVMSYEQEGKMVCYIFAKPTKKTGNYRKRSEPYLIVTHINDQEDQVSITPGYDFKKGTKPYIQIDNKKYRFLIVKEDRAWSIDRNLDDTLITNMKKGSRFRVQSTSTLGTYSIDYYSLMGFTKAYQNMKTLCKGIETTQNM